MSDTLTAIDRALQNLCPCGADPQPGSAYCGDDCTPTHLGAHVAPSLGSLAQSVARMCEGIEAMRSAFAVYGRSFTELTRRFAEAQPQRNPEPDHPMLAAIERRRNRNTGPERRQRPPKQISPRR